MSGAYQYGHFPRGMRLQGLVVCWRKSNQDQTIMGDAGEKDNEIEIKSIEQHSHQRASPWYFGNGFRIFKRYIDHVFFWSCLRLWFYLGVQIVWKTPLDHSIWQAGVPMLCRPWTVYVDFQQQVLQCRNVWDKNPLKKQVEAKLDLVMLNISINRNIKTYTWAGWV